MDRKALFKHLDWLNLDTSSLNNEGVACYRFALKRVAEFVNSQPLDKEEAAKILSDYVDFIFIIEIEKLFLIYLLMIRK